MNYWGDPEQEYDYTTYDDTAAFVAAAVKADGLADGGLQIVGDAQSAAGLREIAEAVSGRSFRLNKFGDIPALESQLETLTAEHPNDPMRWAGLQYHRVMATGRVKHHEPINDRYPRIEPVTVSDFLRRTFPAS